MFENSVLGVPKWTVMGDVGMKVCEEMSLRTTVCPKCAFRNVGGVKIHTFSLYFHIVVTSCSQWGKPLFWGRNFLLFHGAVFVEGISPKSIAESFLGSDQFWTDFAC
jgi:hypothetical protein